MGACTLDLQCTCPTAVRVADASTVARLPIGLSSANSNFPSTLFLFERLGRLYYRPLQRNHPCTLRNYIVIHVTKDTNYLITSDGPRSVPIEHLMQINTKGNFIHNTTMARTFLRSVIAFYCLAHICNECGGKSMKC